MQEALYAVSVFPALGICHPDTLSFAFAYPQASAFSAAAEPLWSRRREVPVLSFGLRVPVFRQNAGQIHRHSGAEGRSLGRAYPITRTAIS